MLSIIIPSRNEPYLNATIQDILKKADGDIELFVHVEGDTPEFIKDGRVTYIFSQDGCGMRGGINKSLSLVRGDYIMKCDAHCAFAAGFDNVLTKDIQENWLVIPRRYSLDINTWDRNLYRRVRDYHYLSYPHETEWGYGMYIIDWFERGEDKKIDDTMVFQGSCWVANKKYFMEHIGKLDSEHYSPFGCEQIELGLKYWLKGGEVKVNKNTWYAHLHKNKDYYYSHHMFSKGYKKEPKTCIGRTWATKHWLRNEEEGQIHPFSWLIEKFWPVPGWPEDKKLWTI